MYNEKLKFLPALSVGLLSGNQTFNFETGKIYGLAGNNGSGKSDVLRTIMQGGKFSSGLVRFNGIDPADCKICYIEQKHHDFYYATGYDMLKFYFQNQIPETVFESAEKFGISLRDKVDLYPNAHKFLFQLLQALKSDYKIVLIDEPLGVLDGDTQKKTQAFFSQESFSMKITLVTSVNTDYLSAFCDNILHVSRTGNSINVVNIPVQESYN